MILSMNWTLSLSKGNEEDPDPQKTRTKVLLNYLTAPHDAVVSSIHKLVYECKRTKKLALKQGKSQ